MKNFNKVNKFLPWVVKIKYKTDLKKIFILIFQYYTDLNIKIYVLFMNTLHYHFIFQLINASTMKICLTRF